MTSKTCLMKIRNPKNRADLKIKRSDRVLEVGGGHNPHPRSNVVVDKFTDSNYHRCGDIKLLKNQTFIAADGEHLPFNDNEFDYLICCQVLEHVEDPDKFLKEQFRVAKKGFIETPSLLGEYLFPRESHKWILHEYNDVLYLMEKSKIDFNVSYNLTELIQLYLPTHSIGFKILERTHPNLFTIRLEWDHDFNYTINTNDREILKFFTEGWKLEWANAFFPNKSIWKEFRDASLAFMDMTKSIVKSRLLK